MPEQTIQEKNLSLVSAVAAGKPEIVAACLSNGADIHYDDDLALRSAAYLGYLDMVELLLKSGANVHADGDVALFAAVMAHDLAMAEKLVDKGANVQAVLDRRKRELDSESLHILDAVQTRSAKIAFEKNFAAYKEKTHKSGHGGLKPKAP